MKKILSVLLLVMLLVPQKTYAYSFSEDILTWNEYYAGMYGFDAELGLAIIWVESRGVTDAINGNCIGICQVNLASQSDTLHEVMSLVGATDEYDIRAQIKTMYTILYGYSWYSADEQYPLSYTLDLYSGNSKAKYNMEKGITSDYVASVLDIKNALQSR